MLQVTRISIRGSVGHALVMLELHLTDSCATDDDVRRAVPELLTEFMKDDMVIRSAQHLDIEILRRDPSTAIVWCWVP